MYRVRYYDWTSTLGLQEWLNQMQIDGWDLVSAMEARNEKQYFIFCDRLSPTDREKYEALKQK